MSTQKSHADRANSAVLARGNGFYYAIRRFVGDAVEAHRYRNQLRHTMRELDGLPNSLKRDIDWPGIAKHEKL